MRNIVKIKEVKKKVYFFDYRKQKFLYWKTAKNNPEAIELIKKSILNISYYPNENNDLLSLITSNHFKEDIFNKNLYFKKIRRFLFTEKNEFEVHFARRYKKPNENHTGYCLPVRIVDGF